MTAIKTVDGECVTDPGKWYRIVLPEDFGAKDIRFIVIDGKRWTLRPVGDDEDISAVGAVAVIGDTEPDDPMRELVDRYISARDAVMDAERRLGDIPPWKGSPPPSAAVLLDELIRLRGEKDAIVRTIGAAWIADNVPFPGEGA